MGKQSSLKQTTKYLIYTGTQNKAFRRHLTSFQRRPVSSVMCMNSRGSFRIAKCFRIFTLLHIITSNVSESVGFRTYIY